MHQFIPNKLNMIHSKLFTLTEFLQQMLGNECSDLWHTKRKTEQDCARSSAKSRRPALFKLSYSRAVVYLQIYHRAAKHGENDFADRKCMVYVPIVLS